MKNIKNLLLLTTSISTGFAADAPVAEYYPSTAEAARQEATRVVLDESLVGPLSASSSDKYKEIIGQLRQWSSANDTVREMLTAAAMSGEIDVVIFLLSSKNSLEKRPTEGDINYAWRFAAEGERCNVPEVKSVVELLGNVIDVMFRTENVADYIDRTYMR